MIKKELDDMAEIQEFINPKSMITPGAAAALVAMVSGAFFSMFGISLPPCLLCISFFFAAVVFWSREFQDQKMSKLAKGFFYILNAFIIFAMATGTHAVLDKEKRTMIIGKSSIDIFFPPAYAQDKQTTPTVLKQKKPLFYDWTKSDMPLLTPAGLKWHIKVEYSFKEKNYGAVRKALGHMGLFVLEYDIKVKVVHPESPAGIKTVKYNLPEAYFDTKTVIVKDKESDFALQLQVWKPFILCSEIELESGKKVQVKTPIILLEKEAK